MHFAFRSECENFLNMTKLISDENMWFYVQFDIFFKKSIEFNRYDDYIK